MRLKQFLKFEIYHYKQCLILPLPIFKDPPDPPIKLKIGLITKNTVHLSWKPPKNDGGSPVTHYIVECLAWDPTGKKKEAWKQCNKRDVEELEFTVEDLVEGGEYEFRVKAVNAAGVSKPSATVGPVTVKDQTCKSLHINCKCPLQEPLPSNLISVQSKKKNICTSGGCVSGM